ncbi:MAG: DUF805 domain-containing protein [Rhizobiaceae bacterium]
MADKAGPQSVFWALFSLKGRIRRATYGLGMALIFCIWWVALSQLIAVQEGSDQFATWALLSALVVLISGYCIYALCHKRLHDLGYPGPYALIVVVAAPFLTGFLFLPLVLVGVLKGQQEDNKYGPPPVR